MCYQVAMPQPTTERPLIACTCCYNVIVTNCLCQWSCDHRWVNELMYWLKVNTILHGSHDPLNNTKCYNVSSGDVQTIQGIISRLISWHLILVQLLHSECLTSAGWWSKWLNGLIHYNLTLLKSHRFLKAPNEVGGLYWSYIGCRWYPSNIQCVDERHL